MDRLPFELISEILDFAIYPESAASWPKAAHYALLSRTSGVCRSLLAVSRSKLYRRLGRSVTGKSSLHEAIANNPAVAAFVREIEVDWDGPDSETIGGWSTYRKAKWLHGQILAFIDTWDACPNLQAIRLEVDFCDFGRIWKDFRRPLRTLWTRHGAPRAFQAVKTLDIHSPDDAYLEDVTPALHILDIASNVTELTIEFGVSVTNTCTHELIRNFTDDRINLLFIHCPFDDAEDYESADDEVYYNKATRKLEPFSQADDWVNALQRGYDLSLTNVSLYYEAEDRDVDEVLALDATGSLVFHLSALGVGTLCNQVLRKMPDLHVLTIWGHALQEDGSFLKSLSALGCAKTLEEVTIYNYSWDEDEDWSLLSTSSSSQSFANLIDFQCYSNPYDDEQAAIFASCLSKAKLLQITSVRPLLTMTFVFDSRNEGAALGELEVIAKEGKLSKETIKSAAVGRESSMTEDMKDKVIAETKRRIGWW